MASVNNGNTHLENSLARDGSSVFALTFDEFQNAMGDPSTNLGSMNIEELLRNIWTAEESQAMAAAMSSADGPNGVLVSQFSLQKQGSLCLPRTLSTKTVEEVWKSLQPHEQGMAPLPSGAINAGVDTGARQITLGEVTLEDFLVKAGIVREREPLASNNQACPPFGGNLPQSDFRNHGMGNENGSSLGLPQYVPAGGNVLVGPPLLVHADVPQGVQLSPAAEREWMVNPYNQVVTQALEGSEPAYSNTSVVTNGGALMDASPSCMSPGTGGLRGGLGMNNNVCFSYGAGSPAPEESSLVLSGMGGQQGRKRCAEGPLERVIERRQRRMIKNRESAARSRARKQAYTVELEAEVSQLKEENMKLLRKQQEEAERRKQQILASMRVTRSTRVKSTLKRTYTGPW